jgi:hypothetical protein
MMIVFVDSSTVEVTIYIETHLHQNYHWGRRDRMVVGYITTYVTSAYHH